MKTTKVLLLTSTSALVAGVARGSVLYSGVINDTLTGTNAYQLDLNQDGTTDFTIRFDGLSTPNNNKPFVDSRTTNPNAFSLGYTNNGVPVTPAGTAIGANYAATYPANTVGYLYEEYNGAAVVGDWSSTAVTDGYVGLELNNGTSTDFGWVQLIYDPTAATPSLTVVDYAYETTPGVDIVTGVPEPATIALAGAGAALMLLCRRKK